MLCPNWGFRAGVENSRYTSTDSLRDTATALGLERTDVHLTAKLVYMLFRLENDTADNGWTNFTTMSSVCFCRQFKIVE